MAVGDEVSHRQAGPAAVIGADEVDAGDVVDLEIEQHHRCAAPDLLGEQRVVVAGRDDDEAVDPGADQPLEDRVAALTGAVGASGDDDVAVRPGDVLEPAIDRREERVGDVERNEPDRRAAVPRRRSSWARWSGRYPSAAMAARTRSATTSRTAASSLTTRETVFTLTPAAAATSRIVGRRS